MKRTFSKIRLKSFITKTNVLSFQNRLGNSLILWTDCIKDLGVSIARKLHSHRHIGFLVSHALKLLRLIRTITSSLSTLAVSLLMLYFPSGKSELDHASGAWNSVTITDSNKFERKERKFAAHCHNRCVRDMWYQYDNLLERSNLLTLRNRRRQFDAFFIISAFSGTEHRPSVLETVGLRGPARNIRIFSMFTCPSGGCVSALKLTDIFTKSCSNVKSLGIKR
jgi:hypothetical protein